MPAAWPFFFSHWATSRQSDEFDRWSGGPAVPHNSIAACLAHSRSGCLRGANSVVPMVGTWRLSQARKSSSTIANSEPLIGSMWSSLTIRSSPDLSASRTTAAALPLLAFRRWQTSAMASPNDSNRVLPATLFSLLRSYASRYSGMLAVGHEVDRVSLSSTDQGGGARRAGILVFRRQAR